MFLEEYEMKKFFALLLAMVMVLSLAACGGKEAEAPAAAPAAPAEAPAKEEAPAEEVLTLVSAQAG